MLSAKGGRQKRGKIKIVVSEAKQKFHMLIYIVKVHNIFFFQNNTDITHIN